MSRAIASRAAAGGAAAPAIKVAVVPGSDNRWPRQPRIEILGAAEPRESAAVVAAIEQFLADTAPAPEPAPARNPWQRAALVEGVMAKQVFGPERMDGWR